MRDLPTLTHCLKKIANNRRDKIVLVPGGGVFADRVRTAQQQWGFDDKVAHAAAILAMQQMGLCFSQINRAFKVVGSLSALQHIRSSQAVIWSPASKQLRDARIKASWNVSSDSLAAWLANRLVATDLVLVKSAVIRPPMTIKALQKAGVLDHAFADFIKAGDYKVTVVNKHRFSATMR